MIAIINRSPIDVEANNECNYEIKINSQTITWFKHKQKDGLSTCLRKASEAVYKKEKQDIDLLVNTIIFD